MNYPYMKRMRDLREDSFLTQQQIADVLGISQTMYARYERGANELPIRHLMVLCDYYRVTSDYFLGRSDRTDGMDGDVPRLGHLFSGTSK